MGRGFWGSDGVNIISKNWHKAGHSCEAPLPALCPTSGFLLAKILTIFLAKIWTNCRKREKCELLVGKISYVHSMSCVFSSLAFEVSIRIRA